MDKATLVASALAFCGLILGVALARLAQKAREMDDYSAIRIFGLAFLVCMLLLFRLKPYAFGALVLFAIAAIIFPRRMLRRIGYVTLSVLPWLCTSAWLAPTEIVRDYYQIICLAAFVVIAVALQIFFFTSTTARPAPAATEDGPAPAG